MLSLQPDRSLAQSTCARPAALVLVFAIAMAGLEQTAHGDGKAVYQPNPNPPTDGRVGSNYTPAYAVNQVQFWHDFRPDVVERELAAARKYFGISTLRVFLHDINFFQDREALLANMERFLAICEKHNIKPGFVFFDGCHRHEGIYLDRPTEPVRGFHNSRWAQSPQARHFEKDNLEKFKPYVQEIIRPYRTDERVMFWEIHNEPPPGDEHRDRLKRAGYRRHGWADCDASDIVNAHVYAHNYGGLDYLADCNPAKGTVITEAGARWKATIRNFGDPCEMIHWLEGRRRRGETTPGVYLCWELMAGNSNCRWHWRDTGYARGTPDPEPEIPWCGLLWPDATPVSLAEAETIRRYTTGESRALLLSRFEHSTAGWTAQGAGKLEAINALNLGPDVTALAGEVDWKDYVVECTVALRPKKRSDAGSAALLVRASTPGGDLTKLKAYAVVFNTDKQLTLTKITGDQQTQLATFDLTTLATASRLYEWNMIRVAVEGPRIRVWLNRMHPSSDPARGLRIDYNDKSAPILTGSVGLQARGIPAWFDNAVVLPIGELP